MQDNIGFLIGDTARLLRRRFDERARMIGVTRPQWRTLTAISRNEGITQGRLAELVEVEAITLCRMIDRLEEAGHVERRRDPGDRRAWNLYLTERSRPLIERLGVIADDLFLVALDGLDPADQATFVGTLSHIQRNLTASDDQETAHG